MVSPVRKAPIGAGFCKPESVGSRWLFKGAKKPNITIARARGMEADRYGMRVKSTAASVRAEPGRKKTKYQVRVS